MAVRGGESEAECIVGRKRSEHEPQQLLQLGVVQRRRGDGARLRRHLGQQRLRLIGLLHLHLRRRQLACGGVARIRDRRLDGGGFGERSARSRAAASLRRAVALSTSGGGAKSLLSTGSTASLFSAPTAVYTEDMASCCCGGCSVVCADAGGMISPEPAEQKFVA